MSYGDWAQWRRRARAAMSQKKDIIGINCSHTPDVMKACRGCFELGLAWRHQHGLPDQLGRLTAVEAAEALASR